MVVYKKREAVFTLEGINLLILCLCQRWVYLVLNSLQEPLLERASGTSLLEEIQCNREWHHRKRP